MGRYVTDSELEENIRVRAVQSLGQAGAGSAEAIAGLLTALKAEKAEIVRSRAAESLGRLAQKLSDEMNDILLDALKNSGSWLMRQEAARLIGRLGKENEQHIQALYSGLLDEYNYLRAACMHGLVLFARRFPATYAAIEKLFMQAIEQSEFDKQDNAGRSAHDHAYDKLWLLAVGGEIEDEDE